MIRCIQKDEHKGYICRKHVSEKIGVYCYDVGCLIYLFLMQKFNSSIISFDINWVKFIKT
jgi:hypothetical protein